MNNAKYTPTPWHTRNGKIFSDARESELVAEVNYLPDADFIIHVVNSHERLLSDLKDAYIFISANSAYNSLLCSNLRATIDKVEGE